MLCIDKLQDWYNYEASGLTEKDIHKLAMILSIAENPSVFRTLKCEGIFWDDENSRYGFVFIPPDYIENTIVSHPNSPAYPPTLLAKFTQKYPLQFDALSITRKPVTLFELIEDAGESQDAPTLLDLGIRFQLAKKIVHSIYVMHAVGWIHKNIRSSSGKSTALFKSCKILPVSTCNTGPVLQSRLPALENSLPEKFSP